MKLPDIELQNKEKSSSKSGVHRIVFFYNSQFAGLATFQFAIRRMEFAPDLKHSFNNSPDGIRTQVILEYSHIKFYTIYIP